MYSVWIASNLCVSWQSRHITHIYSTIKTLLNDTEGDAFPMTDMVPVNVFQRHLRICFMVYLDEGIVCQLKSLSQIVTGVCIRQREL